MEQDLKAFQKKQAIDCFNKTWDFIDMPERTQAEDLDMIHCAHASRYLWGQVGENVHFARGEWLISKVYAIVGCASRALAHAQACLTISLDGKLEAFDIAFAHEAMAQAYKISNDSANVDLHREKAYEALKQLGENDENYAYTKGELDKI